MSKIPAPKPANFDALSRTWNDPVAFARERAAYYRSLIPNEGRDVTVPLHEREDV